MADELKATTQETQADAAMSAHEAIVWNSVADQLNKVKTSDVLNNFPEMNQQGSSLNVLKEDVEGKEDETLTLDSEVNALDVDMQNRREVLNTQLAACGQACKSLDLWTTHATPIINVQEDAVVQVSSWVNHIEGQFIMTASMLCRIEKRLKGSDECEDLMAKTDDATKDALEKPIQLDK